MTLYDLGSLLLTGINSHQGYVSTCPAKSEKKLLIYSQTFALVNESFCNFAKNTTVLIKYTMTPTVDSCVCLMAVLLHMLGPTSSSASCSIMYVFTFSFRIVWTKHFVILFYRCFRNRYIFCLFFQCTHVRHMKQSITSSETNHMSISHAYMIIAVIHNKN